MRPRVGVGCSGGSWSALRWCLGHIRGARGWAGVWDQEWRAWERQEAAWDLPGTLEVAA